MTYRELIDGIADHKIEERNFKKEMAKSAKKNRADENTKHKNADARQNYLDVK